jgi:hypothetical protein
MVVEVRVAVVGVCVVAGSLLALVGWRGCMEWVSHLVGLDGVAMVGAWSTVPLA